MKINFPAAIVAILFQVLTSNAQPGTLDLSFHTTGKTTTQIGTLDDHAFATTVQPDGKIIVAGYSELPSASFTVHVMALARYNPDGNLDTHFGQNGIVTTSFGIQFPYDEIRSVAVQQDGKIIAAGSSLNSNLNGNNDFALVRYMEDGSPDSTFGIGGKVTTDFNGQDDLAYAILLQPDGKIIAAGGNGTYVASRYFEDGTPDTSFNHTGYVSTQVAMTGDNCFAAALQPDGKILLAGQSFDNSTGYDFTLLRYNPDGSLDYNFDNDGIVTTELMGMYDYATCIALQPDGKIIVAGNTSVSLDYDFAMVRYLGNGELDSAFGYNGFVRTNFGSSSDFCSAVLLRPDGKIILAGQMAFVTTDFILVQYLANGSIDTSFGNSGKCLTDFGNSNDAGCALAFQPDGKIILAGNTVSASGTPDFAVARYISGLNNGVSGPEIRNNPLSCYPNPASDFTTLNYFLASEERISVELFDLQGKIVKKFFENEIRSPGNHNELLITDFSICAGNYRLVLRSKTAITSTALQIR